MQQQAVVLTAAQDAATVAVRQQDACASCHATCVGCHQTLHVTAVNRVGAQVGDTVLLESSSARIIGMAASVFLLPLLLTFIAYAVVRLLSLPDPWSYATAAIVGALTFAAAATLWNRSLRQRPDLRIVKIIKSHQAENGALDG